MNRTALRSMTRTFLGVKDSDGFYTTARVDQMLNLAESQLAEEIRRQAPDMLRSIATLASDVSNGRTYTLATQAPPITNFHEVLELRLDSADGVRLTKVDDDALGLYGGSAYSIVGADGAAVITVDDGVSGGSALYLKYGRKSAVWDDPTASPESVPVDFHDLVALRAAETLFSLGGESSVPPGLQKLLLDRSGQLWHHVGRRSRDPHFVRTVFGDVVETMRR